MKIADIFSIFIVFFSVIYVTGACKGCLNLDEYNFDKIVPKFEAVFVKFDLAFPYGDKHEIFAKVADDIVDNKNLILANVGVKDYGAKENLEFAKKFGINSKDELPALKLFVEGEDEPFTYDKNSPWTEDSLKKFIRDHTNIFIGLPGCIESFDKLAIKFTTSKSQEKVLKEAEKEAKTLTGREKDIASTYIKFMKKSIDNGISFIKQESNRLTKIIKDGQINEKKKEELSHRLNILKSFEIKPGKSEL